MKQKEYLKLFKALANKRRLEILKYLNGRKMASVGDIAEHLKLSLPSTSKHLNILYSADLLEKEQHRLSIYYRLSSEMLPIAHHVISDF